MSSLNISSWLFVSLNWTKVEEELVLESVIGREKNEILNGYYLLILG